jgi:hypothetical protein
VLLQHWWSHYARHDNINLTFNCFFFVGERWFAAMWIPRTSTLSQNAHLFLMAQLDVWSLCCTFSSCFELCFVQVIMSTTIQQWSMYCLDFLLLLSRFSRPHFCIILVMMKPCGPSWMWQTLVKQSFFFWKSLNFVVPRYNNLSLREQNFGVKSSRSLSTYMCNNPYLNIF